jgi:hypothetical protein
MQKIYVVTIKFSDLSTKMEHVVLEAAKFFLVITADT